MTRIGVRPPLQITTMGPVSEAESDEAAWVIEPVPCRARSRAGHGAGRLRTPCTDPRGRAQPEAGLSVEMSDRRPPLFGVAEAAQRLAFSGGRYLVFVGCATGRSEVIYRRYDGHYGRITPVADEGG